MSNSAFKGGISQVEIGTDDSVIGNGSSVVVDTNRDILALDFSEDMFRNSMSGAIAIANVTGWDGQLGGVQGTEWVTITFNAKQYVDGEEKPYTVTQRFKVYKVVEKQDETNQLTVYIFHFTTYQFLIDSLKFEDHLSNRHIGPIASQSGEGTGSLTNQDYGLVNKIFDVAGFELDIGTQDEDPLDIEPTANWINYVPGYLDDRNTPDVMGEGYFLGIDTQGIYNNSENSEARPRKVFELLNELAENAVAQENSNAANFFVWHDLKGWHFRSVDSYLRGREQEVDQVYSYDISGPNSDSEVTRIIELNVLKQVDYMDLLNKQALSSKVVYYELNPEEPFAAYYATLPSSLGGLQKVIGPSGLDSSIGNTVIEQQAVVEGSLEYDYLKDRDKWNSVETYPIIRSEDKQFTNYTKPSFLEVPPIYMAQGIGRNSWFGTSSYDLNADWYGWYNSSYRTINSFYQTNPHEFFKTKFARQSDLSGEKFRIVHDDIKLPIIEALKEYYLACLQRLYYEHNFIIDSGLNSLESGEGTLGRGPNQEFCEFCSSREEILAFYNSSISQEDRDIIFDFIEQNEITDQNTIDRIILGEIRPTQLVGRLPNDFYSIYGRFLTCTSPAKDPIYFMLGGLSEGTSQGGNIISFEEKNEYFDNIPDIEIDQVPRLSSEYIGQSYPRCENQEPLLPYNGDPVDCETLKEKWNNIPSECGLITQYLGKEYVSPNIRGVHGDPINWYNSMFWNGYWVNPRFGLPNIRNFRRFFANQDYTVPQKETFKQFFEKDLFLKDFADTLPDSFGSQGVIANLSSYISNSYSTFYFYNYDYYGNTISSLFTEGVPAHYITISGLDFDLTELTNIPSDPDPETGEVIEEGEGSTRTFERNPEIIYDDNPKYRMVSDCAIPQLCGHSNVAEETISVPTIKKFKLIRPGDRSSFNVESYEVEELNVRWPAIWTRGNPYSIGTINTIPVSLSQDGLTDFLRQFSVGVANLDFSDDFLENDQRTQPVAAIADTLNEIYLNGNYFPNQNLQLYDQSRPIYNAKDWQNFQDCNGTCVGVDNKVTDTSKSVEYAKYCSYAWNRYWSTPKEQPVYRRAQVALIQAQEVEITVPNDMDMSVGKLVGIRMPRSTSNMPEPGEVGEVSKVNPISGKYLVTGIRRVFDSDNNASMKLRLNRDSLPYDPSA